MRYDFNDDLFRYVGNQNKSFRVRLRHILFTLGVQYIYLLRKTSNARFFLAWFFWAVLLRCCMFKIGIQIPASTTIGKGFRILHFGTIVINPGSQIGKNFNISQGCLIGNSLGRSSGVPVIGDNV